MRLFRINLALSLFVIALSACGGGAATESDSPSSPPTPPTSLDPTEQRVFLFNNYGAGLDGNLGGVAGADALCQFAATVAGLSENYRAIVSDYSFAAKDRLTITGDIYLYSSPSNRILISRAGKFWTDEYFAPINITESYQVDHDRTVWTGTTQSGNIGGTNCSNWTSNHPDPNNPFSQLGQVGASSRAAWVGYPYSYARCMAFDTSGTVPCNYHTGAVYCISQ